MRKLRNREWYGHGFEPLSSGRWGGESTLSLIIITPLPPKLFFMSYSTSGSSWIPSQHGISRWISKAVLNLAPPCGLPIFPGSHPTTAVTNLCYFWAPRIRTLSCVGRIPPSCEFWWETSQPPSIEAQRRGWSSPPRLHASGIWASELKCLRFHQQTTLLTTPFPYAHFK